MKEQNKEYSVKPTGTIIIYRANSWNCSILPMYITLNGDRLATRLATGQSTEITLEEGWYKLESNCYAYLLCGRRN